MSNINFLSEIELNTKILAKDRSNIEGFGSSTKACVNFDNLAKNFIAKVC